jgi:lipoprotein-anchoring transpeptidase ErfK/SrfK
MRLSFFLSAVFLCASGLAGQAREVVSWDGSFYTPGTIVISQHKRELFLVVGPSTAIAYPVAVAKSGKEWLGAAHVDGKYVEPAWSPPDSVKVDHPEIPEVIAGGAANNPMGARALTLDRDEIAIHGTSRSMRASIGHAASYGCIRMLNEDVIDLFARVRVGTPVVMTR